MMRQAKRRWGARVCSPFFWRQCVTCKKEFKQEPMVELFQCGPVASRVPAFSLFFCMEHQRPCSSDLRAVYDEDINAAQPRKPSSLTTRLRCWFTGHQWRVLREAGCSVLLMHLHAYAACDADCDRCGAEWRDYEPHRNHRR